jgi:hypothetical protein
VLDPAAAGTVALVVYLLHGFQGSLARDQGTFVYAGQEVARGVPPFVGIFNSVGPLGDVVTGVGIRMGSWLGVDAVLAARLTYLLFSVAAVVALSVLARVALRSRAAGLLAPALFLTFGSFLKLATDGPREKTVMVVCLELALLMMLQRRWFWAGALTGLATLTWQPVLLSAVAAALVAVVTSGAPRVRAAATYVVGGLVPAAVVVVAYAVSGHLQVAWWGFAVVNVGYTSQPTIFTSRHVVTRDYGVSIVLVVVGWVLALVWGVLALRRARGSGRDDSPQRDRALLVLAAGGLVAGVWTCYATNGGPDLFVVLPYAALGLAYGVVRAARALPPLSARRVVAAVAVLGVVAAAAESVNTRDSRLPLERRDSKAVAALLPPGSTIVSINTPSVLVLLDRRNPNPWQLSTSATAPFYDDHLPGGLAGLSRRIARLHPAVIVVGRSSEDGWLQPLLRSRYVRIGPGTHWAWWASTSLDPAIRDRMRRANAAVWGR